MAATLRELRGRIRSASSIKKITKAQELIATSRIAKAQARVDAARPYSTEITNMLTELAGASALDHPLLVQRENPKRAGVLVVSSDRGLCGGYNANVLRRAEELFSLLREEGKNPVLYVVGRKALGYYSFRQRDGDRVVDRLLRAADLRERQGDRRHPGGRRSCPVPTTRATTPAPTASWVSTNSTSSPPNSGRCSSQTAVALRIAPMVVEYVGERRKTGPHTLYSFEPNAEDLFDALLPRYIATRVYAALLEAAASESASRRRAMKSATDNADDLIKALDAGGQPRTSGADHPGNQRDRGRRERAGRRALAGPKTKAS